LLYEDLLSGLLNLPALDRIQSWSTQSLARLQTEAGVMPRTPYFVIDNQAFREWPMVVRAVCPHGEESGPAPNQQDLFSIDHSQQLSTVREARSGNSILEVWLFRVAHIPRLTAYQSRYGSMHERHSSKSDILAISSRMR
jgi:hypothetical protein